MTPRISSDYRRLNAELHAAEPDFGALGAVYAGTIAKVAASNGFQSVLDYGCGKGTLRAALADIAPALSVHEYDPAIPGKDSPPPPCDLVVALDVMEHIEPASLTGVLEHIHQLARGGVFFVIDTVPAQRTLSDGRNAHLIVQPLEWWTEQIKHHRFAVLQSGWSTRNGERGNQCYVAAAPLKI